MTSSGNGGPPSDCLDEIALAELADGLSDRSERASRIAHVASCGRCREQLSSILRLLSDEEVAAEVRQQDRAAAPARSRRGWLRAVPLVAAAVIVAIALPRYRPSTRVTPVHRESTDGSGSGPAILSPTGDVRDAHVLRWSALPGADLYRVTLYDGTSKVVFEAEAHDTSVGLPDSVTIVPERSYLWKVQARTGIGRWEASELIEFRLTPRRAR